NGDGGWSSADSRARDFVAQLAIPELVKRQLWLHAQAQLPRLRWLCLQDSPVGVRDADYTSLFPAGMNV
ncbi:glycoside hydrolase family 3 protein, partial [Athelia psychrophila]